MRVRCGARADADAPDRLPVALGGGVGVLVEVLEPLRARSRVTIGEDLLRACAMLPFPGSASKFPVPNYRGGARVPGDALKVATPAAGQRFYATTWPRNGRSKQVSRPSESRWRTLPSHH